MENPRTISQSTDSIDFSKLLLIIRNNWIWILIIMILINSGAYLFIRYTKNIYESESELKLEVKSNATELGIKNVIEDQNLNVVSGEIEIIQSKLFLNQVLDHASLEITFYSVGRVLNEELFTRAPATITYYNHQHNLYDQAISFEELNPKQFVLHLEKGPEVPGTYGQKVVVHDLELILERNDDFVRGDEIGYFFVINSREQLLDYLSRSLTVEPLNYNANTIRIAFKDYNPLKAKAILSKIDTLYLRYSNEQKNLANKQKIDWLAQELRQLEKRMEDYENYFENFTLQNKTNDLDEDLRQTILSINAIDSQRYEMTRKVNALSRLINGLNIGNGMISLSLRQSLPATLIEELEKLQQLQNDLDRLRLSYHEITFAYRQKQKEMESLRSKAIAQLKELETDWMGKLRELNQKKSRLENEFAGLPDKNTEFSKNQRFYKLYEEFYLSLMQSKSQFEIAQAGSISDFKILSPASFPYRPISPNKPIIAGIGVVASFACSLFFIGILYLINNKINNIHELERLEIAPVLGTIPALRHSNGGLYILEHPKSIVSEAIRTLRTNLDFFQVNGDKKVIAISSTVSGEGKSFIAMNLGGVMALSKKKVILIDLDMRKPKLNGVSPQTDTSKGVSTVLIRKNSWQECIVSTSLENFDFLPAGPHPPNPSELLLNGEFNDLIADLKKHYDFVILDTPPVGLVTDGIMAMKRADISIYVFRANYSSKEFIFNLRRIISVNKFSNITTLLNAEPITGKPYGYGYYEEHSRPGNLKSIFKA